MTDKYAHFHLKNMHIYLGNEKKILVRNTMDTEIVKLLKTREEEKKVSST